MRRARVGRSGRNGRKAPLQAAHPARGELLARTLHAQKGAQQERKRHEHNVSQHACCEKRKWKFADKPGSVGQPRTVIGQSFLWEPRYHGPLAAYPGAARATPSLPYLALPRMGFTVPVLLPVPR